MSRLLLCHHVQHGEMPHNRINRKIEGEIYLYTCCERCCRNAAELASLGDVVLCVPDRPGCRPRVVRPEKIRLSVALSTSSWILAWLFSGK